MFSCQHVMVGTLNRLPVQTERKEGTTSSHHGPYVRGYTRATMDGTEGSKLATASESQNAIHSSDRGLQLDLLKLDSLVSRISNDAVNTFPGLVHTARQAMEVGGT